jgi:ribosomal protein S18 acetylase RimI-like enzyme
MRFTIEGPLLNQTTSCEPILRALPDWFGIETAIQSYAAAIPSLPTFVAKFHGRVIGFLSLKQHNPHAAEIYVMGVHPEAHRQGIGRALLDQAERYAREQGIEYLQVKTLGPSHPDKHYARTRAFYEAMGFCPLEELAKIWGEHNPCLILVKRI